MKPQDNGRNAELAVKRLLKLKGFGVKLIPEYHASYDLLVQGRVRIEVKSCDGIMRGTDERYRKIAWAFNIHRHNIIDESGIDYYVLRLGNVKLFAYPVMLLIPAPLGVPTISISVRSLLQRYSVYARAWVDFTPETLEAENGNGKL
jgi:hypothetical protein